MCLPLCVCPAPSDLHVRFHAIYFPAMLHALELPLPRTLLAHAHWTMGQRKMSKSVGNVADPLAAIARVGVDRVRWYLARAGGRFRDDADWSAPQLDKHARELTDLLGNFFLRVASPAIARRVAGAEWAHSLRGDEAREVLGAATIGRMDELATLGERVGSLMERLEVAQALEAVVHVLQSVRLFVFGLV
jgi:methionyl-tRNA synthetase